MGCTYLRKLFHLPYSLNCIHRCRFQQCCYKRQQRDRGSKHTHQYLHIGLNFRVQHVWIVLTIASCCCISRIAWVACAGEAVDHVSTKGLSVAGARCTLINFCTLGGLSLNWSPACVGCTYLRKLFHLPYSLNCIHRCRFQQCCYKRQQRDRGSKHTHQYLHIGWIEFELESSMCGLYLPVHIVPSPI